VYAAGKKNLGIRFETLIYDLADILGIPRCEILLLNTSPLVNLAMRLGGFISRRLGLALPGRPVVIRGTRSAYRRLVDFVEQNRNLWAGQEAGELSTQLVP
jgi:hypothetical protein